MNFSREFMIALYALNGVGVKTYQKILKTLNILEATESDFWVNKGDIWGKISLNKNIEKSIYFFKKEYTSYSYSQFLLSKEIRVVFTKDQEYPKLLKQIDFPPPIIYVKGAFLNLNQPLAIVGTRHPTKYGIKVLEELVPSLAKTRTIVSGFMYGTDILAQEIVLKVSGYTVGVLGFGFDAMYPASFKQKFTDFIANGASFISPFAPNIQPRPGNFPARNLIVAGMSEGVCVIEAASQSGSLITARLAGELGRDVWAVSGSIFNKFSRGTQDLINQGAKMICRPEDINNEFML